MMGEFQAETDLAAALDSTGIEVAGLLALEGLPRSGSDVVYLSGSLIEGFGNSRSDIDVFILGADRPLSGVVIEKDRFAISIHYVGKRRVDYEYWPLKRVYAIAAALRAIPVGNAFVADKMDPVDKLFIHRLKIGRPLCNAEGLADVRTAFDFDLYRSFLIQEAVHRIDGAMEDVWGMTESGRPLDVLLRARDLVGLAVDAWRFAHGETNPLQKWRPASLARIAAREKQHADILQKYMDLEFPERAQDFNSLSVASDYARRCTGFAEAIVRTIQN